MTTMDRKGFLQQLTLLGGCTLMAPTVLLQSCRVEPRIWSNLSAKDIALLDELGETILPKTDGQPGAKEMEIGKYVVEVVTACLSPEDRDTFLYGLTSIDANSIADFGRPFEDLDEEDRYGILKALQDEAVAFNEKQQGKLEPEIHYFSLLKELVVTGYFTSKTVMTEVFDYHPVPGKYEGCVDFDVAKDKPYKG